MASTGSEPAPRRRVALVTEFMSTTSEPTRNAAQLGAVSILGTWSLTPRLFVGAQAPFVLVDENVAGREPMVGYGDTRFSGFFKLGDPDDKKQTWTLGLNLTVPTRTIRYSADPGSQWLFSPLVAFTHASEKFRVFAMVLTPLEMRPAGTAVELSPSVGAGYQVTPRFSASLAVGANVRLLTWCSGPRGTSFCPEGRATEEQRGLGTTRVYGNLTTWLSLSKIWAVFAAGQLPFTEHKDFAFGANLGVEVRF